MSLPQKRVNSTTYLLLLLMFRSIVLPLKAILMNTFSIGAAYGALVSIFQQGHFQNVLGFTADGSLDRFIPILLFCVLFGLSMDYEVFLLSRIKEDWQRTGENRTAVAHGLERTGGIITNAALLFVIVAASFATTSLIVTKELGLGVAIAVIVDASIIRCVLVPATMQVMGRTNWWFPKLRKAAHAHMTGVKEVSVIVRRRGERVFITGVGVLPGAASVVSITKSDTRELVGSMRGKKRVSEQEQQAPLSVEWPPAPVTSPLEPIAYSSYGDHSLFPPVFSGETSELPWLRPERKRELVES